MSRDGLNRLLSWLVVIVLGIQINHFLANRSDLDPFFDIAFYPDNGGLAVYFGAVLSTVLMFPLIYLTRWRAAVVPDCGWAGKIFRPNMLELDETMPLGKSILRVLFVAGVILPMIGHVWLVHRWIFKDPDVYIRICEEKTVNGEKIPFKDQTVVELYPEVCGTDDTYKKKLTGPIGSNDTRHCIDSKAGPYCRIATDWKGHFELIGSESFWSLLFGPGRESFRLGYDDRLVSYVPVLFPGIGLAACALLLLYWLDTLAMIFNLHIRCWPWQRPPRQL